MNRSETACKGSLYIVATPIGNLEDMTFRAVRVLREVGLIACEDTRRTRKLLTAYQIHTPLTSLHGYNEERKGAAVVGRLSEGMDVAYVTDAGTPGISDPGCALINRAISEGIRVVPIPGPSAAIAALSVSGLPTDGFLFFGFPPHRAGARRRLFASLKEEQGTIVFYESPKRLLASLQDAVAVFGDRKCVLARELTKTFEEIIRGSLREILGALEGRTIKGEVTLVVEGRREPLPVRDDAIVTRFLNLEADMKLSRRDMIDRIAAEAGLPRRTVYQLILKRGKDEG